LRSTPRFDREARSPAAQIGDRTREPLRIDEPERRLDRSGTFFARHTAQNAFNAVAAPLLRGERREIEFDGSGWMKRGRLGRVDPKPRGQPAKNCSLASTRRTPESALICSATALSLRPISSTTL
jgi:hypothetical protein